MACEAEQQALTVALSDLDALELLEAVAIAANNTAQAAAADAQADEDSATQDREDQEGVVSQAEDELADCQSQQAMAAGTEPRIRPDIRATARKRMQTARRAIRRWQAVVRLYEIVLDRCENP